MAPRDALLRHGRALLQRARATPEDRSWLAPDISVDPANGNDRPTEPIATDRRALDRLQLAWALQYDATPADAALIRGVLAHEIAWRHVSPSQGIGETLEILSWLVARDRLVEDVWLLFTAKRANFDTGCGYDREHLIASGFTETLAHVHASTHPGRADLLELLTPNDTPAFTESDAHEWLSARAHWFPPTPEAESPEVWIDRALAIGERTLARQLLDAWSGGHERDAQHLRALIHRYKELGAHVDEAEARDELLRCLTAPSEQAGERCRAATAERRAERWPHALAHLEHAAQSHHLHHAWRELGLGRELVREAYALALVSPLATARRAMAIADELAEHTPRLPPVTRELQARAHARLATA